MQIITTTKKRIELVTHVQKMTIKTGKGTREVIRIQVIDPNIDGKEGIVASKDANSNSIEEALIEAQHLKNTLYP